MNFVNLLQSSARRHCDINSKNEPCVPLQMYNQSPQGLININQFKEYALKRLSLLKIFERANLSYNRDTSSYNNFISSELIKLKFLPSILAKTWTTGSEELANELRIDLISHFTLRLAYCQNEDLRRWFVQYEIELFRFRFLHRLTSVQLNKFLAQNSLDFETISENEKSELRSQLMESNPMMSRAQVFISSTFYKLHFTTVIDLVKSRKVFLKEGFAYVPCSEMVAVVTNRFRTILKKRLIVCSQKAPTIHVQNDRISTFLKRITSGIQISKLKANSSVDDIVADHLDELSKLCFPPCMLQLHEALRAQHHLRHQGRLMYWLYLKGIGLPLEQNLKLFRQEFVDRGCMDSKKFEREHGYNIRHSYGQEGKRTSYTSYSCLKIITDHPPAVGDHHGCPFRHLTPESLVQRLNRWNVDQVCSKKICELSSDKHYQLACQQFFAAKNAINSDSSSQTAPAITHPNQYFIDSFKIRFPNSQKVPSKQQQPLQVTNEEQQRTNDSECMEIDE